MTGEKTKLIARLQVQVMQAHSVPRRAQGVEGRTSWEKEPGTLRGSGILLLELKGTRFSQAGVVEVCLLEPLKCNQDGLSSPGITPMLVLLLVLQKDRIKLLRGMANCVQPKVHLLLASATF